tara:strand:- start:89 stop:334 length:246 start_codon:yes stop_codon:yes gene_type:complete
MRKPANFKVTSKECRGNPERMIRKFIKKTKRSRIIEEVRERKRYKKPSVAKREKSDRARRQRARDEQKRLRAKERRNRRNK